jgi:hypothetical protein
MRGWVALEREYARLATPMRTMEENDEYGIRSGRIDSRQIKTNYSKAVLFTYVRYADPRSLLLQSCLPHYLELDYLVTRASSGHT